MNEWVLLFPWVFLLLPLPFFWYFLERFFQQEKRGVLYFPLGNQAFFETLTQKKKLAFSRFFLSFFLWLLWFLLLLACSRPTLLHKSVRLSFKPYQLYVALDLSRSMSERDIQLKKNVFTSRLDSAKQFLKTLSNSWDQQSLGLLVFASHPYLLIPQTSDAHFFSETLNDLSVGMADPKGEGKVGSVILDSLVVLSDLTKKTSQEKEPEGLVVLLVSDGEESKSYYSKSNALKQIKQSGARVYTLFIGNQTNPRALNLLKQISKETSAKFYQASSLNEIKGVLEKLTLREAPRSSKMFQPKEEFWLSVVFFLFSFWFFWELYAILKGRKV